MRILRAVVVALIAIGLLAGCGENEPITDPEPGLEAEISISRGGGIAGGFYETTIEPDGSGRFDETEYVGPEVEPRGFEVGEGELREIAQVAATTPFEDIGEATNPQCADCFVYSITYGDRELSVDSSTLEQGQPGAEAVDLIEVLSRVGPSPDAG